MRRRAALWYTVLFLVWAALLAIGGGLIVRRASRKAGDRKSREEKK
jgi:uncharacterized membrane protein